MSRGNDFQLAHTPVKLAHMLKYLSIYPDKLAANRINNTFASGFPLHYEGPMVSFYADNSKSARDNPSMVSEKSWTDNTH